MKKNINILKEPHKVIIAVAFVAGFALPAMVQAMPTDDEAPVNEPVVTENEEQKEVKESPVIVLVDDEEENTEEETTTPEETPEPVGPYDIPMALKVAEAEHPNVTVVMVQLKAHEGKAYYKFHFRDGWKVVVDVENGSIVRSYNATKEKKDWYKSWKQHKSDRKYHKNDHKHNSWHKFHRG